MMEVCVSIVLCGAVQANLLLSPSFEDVCEGWAWYGDAGREPWANHTGAYGTALYGWNAGVSGGSYQDVAVTAGTEYTLSAWYLDDQAVVTGLFTANIEWFDGTTLLDTTTQVLTTLVSDVWSQQSFSGTAPVDCDIARVVFQSTDTVSGETLKIDDVSFVPEPATMLIFGLGGLLLRSRKR